jgi:hypothetical protein
MLFLHETTTCGGVAAFVADCRARNLSPATIEFYLEGLTAYRACAEQDVRA